jgi:outer membrane protein assembly factor BamB
MQLQGNRFGLNETVLAYFDDTTQIGSITTDATGQFVLQVTVPKTALPGTHTVRATGQSSGLTTLALFLVRTDWTQPGFGPSHLGNNPYENVLTTSNVSGLTLDWSHPTIDTSPVVANGVVYASSHNELYALDAVTGTLKWSYNTGRSINSSPAVANGVVYVGSNDYNLYALDAATGALRWSYNTGTRNFITSSPTIANGVVYFCSHKLNYHKPDIYALNALDAATGTLRWSNSTVFCVDPSPTVAGGILYICSDTTGLDALDAVTGALKWSTNTYCDYPVVVNGVVYFMSEDFNYPATDYLDAVDAMTGTLKWSYTNGSGPITVANGVVYICPSNGLDALDAVTGALKWSGNTCYTSAVVVNGVVYVLGGVGNGYGLLAFHLPGMS